MKLRSSSLASGSNGSPPLSPLSRSSLSPLPSNLPALSYLGAKGTSKGRRCNVLYRNFPVSSHEASLAMRPQDGFKQRGTDSEPRLDTAARVSSSSSFTSSHGSYYSVTVTHCKMNSKKGGCNNPKFAKTSVPLCFKFSSFHLKNKTKAGKFRTQTQSFFSSWGWF